MYAPWIVIALSGTDTNGNSTEPPNKPTRIILPLFLITDKSSFTVGGAFTKSTILSTPFSLQIDIIFCAASLSFVLTVCVAPNSFAMFNFLSSRSAQIILHFVIWLANCTPINPKPPAPTIKIDSGLFTNAFLIAVYAVNPEHARDDAESGFRSPIFARNL